jgi:hypothetical protein
MHCDESSPLSLNPHLYVQSCVCLPCRQVVAPCSGANPNSCLGQQPVSRKVGSRGAGEWKTRGGEEERTRGQGEGRDA